MICYSYCIHISALVFPVPAEGAADPAEAGEQHCASGFRPKLAGCKVRLETAPRG